MTTRRHRTTWALGMTAAAFLAGAGAFTAAHARNGQTPTAPMPRTVEPVPTHPVEIAPVSVPEISPPPAPVLPPIPSEKPLRPEVPSLTFNPGEVPAAPASLPDAPPTTPGDSTVTLTRQAILSSLVAAAISAGPVSAQGDAAKLTEMQTELKDLKSQIGELKTAQKQINDVILGRGEGKMPDDAGLLKRLEALSDSIKRLDEKVTRIGDQVSTTQRTAGSSPLTGSVTPRGTVRLLNAYGTDVSIVLNGVSYFLTPGQLRDVTVGPGDFGYALPQSGGMETRSRIRDGETVTLRIK